MGLVLPLSSGEKRVAELSDEQGERCMAVLQVAEPGVVVHGAPGGAGKSGGLHIGGLLSVHSQPLRSLECLNGGSSAYLSARCSTGRPGRFGGGPMHVPQLALAA
jgi:hypothetical protein